MSWGVALRNAVGLGLGGIPSLLNAPPYARLAFNFLSGELDPRITFSRTSNATLIGSDGQLQYAPHNLLTYSEQFDNAVWTKAQSTITSNSVTAPDGTTTADKLVEDATNSQHVLFRSTSISLNTTHAASGYFKAGERTRINFRLLNGTFNSGANVTFDLSAGTTPFSSLIGTATNLLFSITPVGDGWYRCSVSCVVDATSTAGVWAAYLVNTGNNDTYTGDGTSGIYTWGAQLNVGALQPYYQTEASAYYGPRFDYDPVTLAAKGVLIEEQRTNQHSYSEDLSQWGAPTNATVSTNVAVAPDGFTTADKLVEDTATSTHFLSATAITHSYVSGTLYTRSCFLKAAERFIVSVYFPAAAFPASSRQALFNLSTGTVYSVESGVTASIQAFGNGWYRCSITATANVTGSAHVGGSALIDNAGNGTYTGNGVSGALIWGAQMEVGAFPTSYIPTTTAAATRAADVLSIIGANFSNWYNQSEGTMVAEATTIKTSGATPIATAQNSGGSDRHQVIVFTNTTATVVGGVTQSLIGTNTAQFVRTAYAYKVNDFAACTNGGTVSTDTFGAVPAVTYATLGKFDFGGGESLNGHIRSFKYYPTRLSNGQLQTLTK